MWLKLVLLWSSRFCTKNTGREERSLNLSGWISAEANDLYFCWPGRISSCARSTLLFLSSISYRAEDTEDCKNSSIWVGCSSFVKRQLGLENLHLIQQTMLKSWQRAHGNRTDLSLWFSKCMSLALPCTEVLLAALGSICSVWTLRCCTWGDVLSALWGYAFLSK